MSATPESGEPTPGPDASGSQPDPSSEAPGPERSLFGQAGRFLGAIGGTLGVAGAFAILFGPAPGMGLFAPSPAPGREAAVVEAVAADPLSSAIILAWPFAAGMVGLYGGYAALRYQRRHVLGTGVVLVFVIMLGPPAMATQLPAAFAFLVAWALFAGDFVVRRRR